MQRAERAVEDHVIHGLTEQEAWCLELEKAMIDVLQPLYGNAPKKE